MELTVFTFRFCRHCTTLKKRLDDENIKYFDFDVEINRQEWLEILKLTGGQDTVPTVYVRRDNSDVGHFYTANVDFYFEDEIIGIIKGYQ